MIRFPRDAGFKRTAAAISVISAYLALIVLLPGCFGFERWKTRVMKSLYGTQSELPDYGVRFDLEGDHTLIGVGKGETSVTHSMWTAQAAMSGPHLQPGDPFKMQIRVTLKDKNILRLIRKSKSPEIYMVAVIAPLYNAEGHFRQFTNIQSSSLLTPTGLPIESLQENLPSRYKQNHYGTPWEIVVKAQPSRDIKGNSILFAAESTVPRDLPHGHYRLGLEFGARIKGHLIKLELIPYLGSILLKEPRTDNLFLTENAVEKTKIRILYSPVFKVGAPRAPRMPWSLFGDVLTHGPRGVLALEDRDHFAISFSGLRYDRVILPMHDERGKRIVYRIEPEFPTQSEQQELFEKTMFYGNLETVLSHIQLEPVALNYKSGYLDVTIRAPSGKTHATGRVPFKDASRYGATTGDSRFDYAFEEYGHYVITMRGAIEDAQGNVYHGGGTYDVWVARPLSMSTSAKPGMPYLVGGAYSPRLELHPGVPADMTYQVRLYRNSSREDVKTWRLSGRANRFGYFFPRDDFEPMVFDSPGEYIAEVTAEYWDAQGALWMGTQTIAGVVAHEHSDITVHGDNRAVQSRPFDPSIPLDFRPRFELKASGYAGTPKISDMTMTQVRMGLPYNREDVLFYSPALLWNVGEIYPLLSFSTTDKALEREVLARFPAFKDFLKSRFQETMRDAEACWGMVFAQDTCRFILLDLVDSSLHKSADNLPVMSMGEKGYQPYAFPDRPEILNYYYSSAIKPGLVGRYVVSDSTNSTSYWIITPNYFGRQFGAGEGGDNTGDIYRFMGGVVYRNLKTGVNKYGIYHAVGIVGDPRDENNRIEKPLGSPLLRVGGTDYDLFAGMSPEPGSLFETGDRMAGGGFIFPSIVADLDFKFVDPDGRVHEERVKTNSFGLLKVFREKYILTKPGMYRVYANVKAGGKQGGIVGKPDSWYQVYVVDRDSRDEISFDLPAMGLFDIRDALEVKGMLPPDWASGKLYYTVISPGLIISDGELPLNGRQFTYRYMPLHASVLYPSLEVYDIVHNRAAGADTVVLAFFADGVSGSGKRITAGIQLLVRGNRVFYGKGRAVKGHPPTIAPTPMYKPFTMDNAPYVYEAKDIRPVKNPKQHVDRKCGSCHAAISGGRTYGEWKRIVNWHMDRNSLWLRDYNRRNLVKALLAVYPVGDSPGARAEADLIKRGEKAYKKSCLSCHPHEPALDRSRSRKGWENIITRHEYWERKWAAPPKKQRKIFENRKQKSLLLEYLVLVAGSDAALPARGAGDPRALFQHLCFNCHATTLGTYRWDKADPRFLKLHITNKFDASRQKQAAAVMDYLLSGKAR